MVEPARGFDHARIRGRRLGGRLAAGDQIEIAADRLELRSRFDNALDGEDADDFASVFLPGGVLAGFWGESTGHAPIRQAHAVMRATFAEDERHVVTNHEIAVVGDHATMFCCLTISDRKALAVTGTATVTDEFRKVDGAWRFVRQTLAADPNVDPIIRSLRG